MKNLNEYRERSMSTATTGVIVEALGQSDAFLAFQEQVARVAPIERPVLIIGERGTGKELAATRLHYLSSRWKRPLVTLNCAALPPSLMESALFGHEKGAFTGAVGRRRGRFEAAHNSTLFLDEIGTIPLEAQEKILRVVEYGAFERVGGTQAVEVDVRVIGATNADLPALARDHRFKQDLLDRLSFEVLFLPPLRARKGDIMLLAKHFARRMAYEMGMEEIPQFSPSAEACLEVHQWPGNIRELKNVVERAVYRSENAYIDRIQLDPFQSSHQLKKQAPAKKKKPFDAPPRVESIPSRYDTLPLKQAVRQLEMDRIREALNKTRYHQKKAADTLGLTYDQLRGLLRKYAKEIRTR